MSEALDRVASLAGIESTFCDYFGNEMVVSDATKRVLLDAMGFDTGSETSLASTAAALQDEPFLRVLPRAVVVPEGTEPALSCARIQSRSSDGSDVVWQIACEDGGLLHGRASWGAAASHDARTVNGIRYERRRIAIVARLPLGYHDLTLESEDVSATCRLIVVPQECYRSPELDAGRYWALSTQLYALRSKRDWGVGDFSDLAALARHASHAGCGAIALNPLHELHPANPAACSPYAPSSRLFLNALYLDVESIPDFSESSEARAMVDGGAFQTALGTLRDGELVNYPGVAALKRRALELLYDSFCRLHLERSGDVRAMQFRRFLRDRGAALERLTLYQALDERFRAQSPPLYGWTNWPSEFRRPEEPAVAKFARTHCRRLQFFAYLQWQADRQLAAAAAAARQRDVGLYLDLAVGADRDGADAWASQQAIVAGAALGAPPDPLNAVGQNWGLPPLSPGALRELAYAPLIELLRANMRYASILRIDHVMALRRAFWIPRDRPALEGAYVNYDFDEMLGIVALESVRHRCTVVGEDLGTVPPDFRERMSAAGVLSSRLLYFERDAEGGFLPASAYPRLSAASVGSHDLPPLAAWWLGCDPASHSGAENRERARFALVDALERADAVEAAVAALLRDDAEHGGTPAVLWPLCVAVYRFLAKTQALLKIVAIEDVLAETGGVNVPGTLDEHPNWRRRRARSLEALPADERLFRIGAIVCDTEAVNVGNVAG